ncbi:MAG TPA: flagellar export protein FliJ [Tepidisphaeraceae bacterium]|nr:flagellar export protein FliJ [Tepidisphaeraceae bacterium]
MGKFVFKLEGLLRQRKHVERERQRLLAEKQVQLVQCENELRELQQTMQASTDELRQTRLIGQLDMGFITAHRRFIGAMHRRGMAMAQKIALAQRSVDEARILLVEAARQRKVIEKLREQQFQRWRENQSRKELADLDEIGMQLAYQNLAEPSESAE